MLKQELYNNFAKPTEDCAKRSVISVGELCAFVVPATFASRLNLIKMQIPVLLVILWETLFAQSWFGDCRSSAFLVRLLW